MVSVEKMIELYNSGKSCYDIAQELNQDYRQVHKSLRLSGLIFRRGRPTTVPKELLVSRRELRSKVFDLLGTKCARCGFSDLRALQIDHINGKSRTDPIGNSRQIVFLRRILNLGEEAKLRFQILCANCNWIKRIENNEC